MSNKDLKKYLPSRKFTTSLLTIVVILVSAILIKSLFSVIKKALVKSSSEKKEVSVTVGDLIQKDSNNNGIPDWEEQIWGLDPTKNGPENKTFILSKKKILTDSGEIVAEDINRQTSDNEVLSRQLLATILALSENGEINDETISSISESIGSQISMPNIPDRYNENDLNIVISNEDTISDYAVNILILDKLYEDYDLGKEMILISQGIANQDALPLMSARTIASSYRLLSEIMLEIEVPSTLHKEHLKILNGYDKLALSIEGLSTSIVNPADGLQSILVYTKITEEISSTMEKLLEIFSSQL